MISIGISNRVVMRRPKCPRNNVMRSKETEIHELQAKPIDSQSFSDYGQIASWQNDGVAYGKQDLQLNVCAGTPRLYMFRLQNKALQFDTITYHAKVTQCLVGIGQREWYMAVSRPPSSLSKFPTAKEIEVFQIPSNLIVKLNVGVWHAGPLFEKDIAYMDFVNLELSNTNVEDHNTHYYSPQNLSFVIIPPPQAGDNI